MLLALGLDPLDREEMEKIQLQNAIGVAPPQVTRNLKEQQQSIDREAADPAKPQEGSSKPQNKGPA
jgi:hypothetical protein